jgi:hypothetical protein
VIRYGFGRDIWDVPFDDINKFYQVGSPLLDLETLNLTTRSASKPSP